MKKYRYHYIDLNEDIYADSGREAEAIYDATHDTPYEGNIELTDMTTGASRMMYHITVIN